METEAHMGEDMNDKYDILSSSPSSAVISPHSLAVELLGSGPHSWSMVMTVTAER